MKYHLCSGAFLAVCCCLLSSLCSSNFLKFSSLKIFRLSSYIIAYRLGDFYEVFGKNAKLLADELDLTLTGRNLGLESRVPLVGFPFHAMDNYVSKIINNGHKIALAEDLNDIKVYEVNGETGEIISTATDDEELITVSELLGETPIEENTDTDDLLSVPPEANDNTYLQSERQNMKAFDIEAMLILQELLDNKITLV